VVPGSNNDLHNAIPGNNLYAVYGTFESVIPHSTFEPYVFWRLAPGNVGLPEKRLAAAHLDEVTVGLRVKGTLSAGFDYDTEFDGQKGSLGPSSIGAWAGYAGVGKDVFPTLAAAPRVFVEGKLRLRHEKSCRP